MRVPIFDNFVEANKAYPHESLHVMEDINDLLEYISGHPVKLDLLPRTRNVDQTPKMMYKVIFTRPNAYVRHSSCNK